MLKWILEPFAPATFTKGIYFYNKGQYEKALRHFKKAGTWMPELLKDDVYFIYSILLDYRINQNLKIEKAQEALDRIKGSKLRVHVQRAEAELDNILEIYLNE